METLKQCCLYPVVTCLIRMSHCRSDRRNVLPSVNHSFLLIPAHQLAKKIRNREV